MRLACGPALACERATRVRGGKRADVLGLVSRGERESGPRIQAGRPRRGKGRGSWVGPGCWVLGPG